MTSAPTSSKDATRPVSATTAAAAVEKESNSRIDGINHPPQRRRLVVTVRPIEERDQRAACEIWRNGLKQTAEYSPWYVRPFLYRALDRMAATSCEPQGDVGPDGSNLMQKWRNTPNRCMFVAVVAKTKKHGDSAATAAAATSVATSCTSEPPGEEDGDSMAAAAAAAEGVVVGCVGVKRGTEEQDREDDRTSEIASIWRMSVEETARRQGVGGALIRAAERWAIEQPPGPPDPSNHPIPDSSSIPPKRQPGIGTMQLVTMNRAAGAFYMSQGYVRNDNERIVPHHTSNPLMRTAFLYLLPPIYYYRKTLQR